MKIVPISIQNETFELHPSGAAYWVEKKTLFIADVHLGKVSHFRKHGSAVPSVVLLENFNKLNEVIQSFGAKRIIFLGDLFHSFSNSEWDFFAHWRMQHRIEILLISGNHDIIDVHKYEGLGISVCESLVEGGFYYTHHPEEHSEYYNLSGHIHPGVRLKGMGRLGVSTPCFYVGAKQMIVPAFGVFTGKYIVEPKKGERIFAIANDEVIDVSVFFTKK